MSSATARVAPNMVKDLATLLAATVKRSVVEREDHHTVIKKEAVIY